MRFVYFFLSFMAFLDFISCFGILHFN
jgi:hypothetical protein